MRTKTNFRPTLNDKLEDRTVPSGMGLNPAAQFGGGLGGLLGELGNILGGFGFGGGSSSAQSQATRAVNQAFQQFNGTLQLDESNLVAAAATPSTPCPRTSPAPTTRRSPPRSTR